MHNKSRRNITKVLKNLLACLILLLFYHDIFGQQKRILVTLSPAFLRSANIAIQPGIEYRFSNTLSGIIEVALPLDKSEQEFDKVNLFRTSIELKKTLAPTSHGAIPYFSLQMAFVSRTFYENDSNVYAKKLHAEERFRYTSATIHSPVFISTIRMGKEYRLGENWWLDIFAGAGARYIHTRYDAQNVRSVIITRRGIRIGEDATNCNCDITRFHATIAFRMMRHL
jgi:hypothetical protein